MQAKIADFRLSKALGTDDDSHVCTRPAGTPGYLDPEFHASGRLTKKSDVYSFGVVLLELITGQPAIIQNHSSALRVIDWVAPLIGGGEVRSIVDSRLRGQFNNNAAWKDVRIALSCVNPSSRRRPDIESVSSDLKECLRLEDDSGHDNYGDGTYLRMSRAKLDYTSPEPRPSVPEKYVKIMDPHNKVVKWKKHKQILQQGRCAACISYCLASLLPYQ